MRGLCPVVSLRSTTGYKLSSLRLGGSRRGLLPRRIRPERLRGEAVLVKQIRPREASAPGVADDRRPRHGTARDDDGIALDLGIAPHELAVLAGDCEALQ